MEWKLRNRITLICSASTPVLIDLTAERYDAQSDDVDSLTTFISCSPAGFECFIAFFFCSEDEFTEESNR